MSIRHKWGDPVSIRDGTPSSCEETERVCILCGIVKITVHPPQGYPWRAWRTKEGKRTDQIDHTPPCLPQGNVEPLAADPSEVPFS